METTNQYILAKARRAGICEEWAQKIAKSNSLDEMLQMYVDGIDFCLAKNFPSNEDLEAIGGDKLRKYGIHIDESVDAVNPRTVVLLGASQAGIRVGSYQVTQIYIKHTSSAIVRVEGNAFVVIDCFDDATLNLQASGDSKILVNVYGKAKVTQTAIEEARIKIVNKLKSTY